LPKLPALLLGCLSRRLHAKHAPGAYRPRVATGVAGGDEQIGEGGRLREGGHPSHWLLAACVADHKLVAVVAHNHRRLRGVVARRSLWDGHGDGQK
jgi:hypothetical protein